MNRSISEPITPRELGELPQVSARQCERTFSQLGSLGKLTHLKLFSVYGCFLANAVSEIKHIFGPMLLLVRTG
jgi:hypothetical protein